MKNKKSELYNLFKRYGNIKQIKSGENIFTYNKPAKNLYFILSGKINLFIKTKNSKERQIDQLKSGDIFGEAALLENNKHNSKAVVSKDANLLMFTPKNFKELMDKQNNFTETIVKNLSKRIKILQEPKKVKKVKKGDSQEDNSSHKNIADIKNFYLKGHKNYNQKATKEYQHYLYTKEIECPVCSNKLEVKKIRNSRLKLNKIRDDLRPIYKDFKPHWYKVWSCPNCFYTAPKRSFFDINKKEKKYIKENFKEKIHTILGDNYEPKFSEPRNINEVFDTYYLAIKLFDLINANRKNYAYLWLRISWLYEDVNEDKLVEKSSYKAMEYLRDFYYEDDSTSLSNNQTNKLILLLAVLFYKHNQSNQAIPLLNELIHENETKKVHRKKARDLFLKIREEQRNENN
ncbi:MAG: DUF2225 domain-containing protein, partial [Bacillota bacterium]